MKLKQVLSILKRRTNVEWYGNNSNIKTALNFDITDRAKPKISINENEMKLSYVLDLVHKYNSKQAKVEPTKKAIIEALINVSSSIADVNFEVSSIMTAIEKSKLDYDTSFGNLTDVLDFCSFADELISKEITTIEKEEEVNE